MDLIWWEKTVEYKFVQEYLGSKFIAPLAGKHEAAGDVIVATGTKLILIEFKRDRTCISTEEKKYKGAYAKYDEAKEILKKVSSHHFMIYGKGIVVDDIPELQLNACGYFSKKPVRVSEVFKFGLGYEKFSLYLRALLILKNATGSVDSGGIDSSAYSMVAGITKDGTLGTCLSLSEFIVQYQQSLSPLLNSPQESDKSKKSRKELDMSPGR